MPASAATDRLASFVHDATRDTADMTPDQRRREVADPRRPKHVRCLEHLGKVIETEMKVQVRFDNLLDWDRRAVHDAELAAVLGQQAKARRLDMLFGQEFDLGIHPQVSHILILTDREP
jgi:hypothetical protein